MTEVARFECVDEDGNKQTVIEERGGGKTVRTYNQGSFKTPGVSSWRLLSEEPVNAGVGRRTFTTLSGKKLRRIED